MQTREEIVIGSKFDAKGFKQAETAVSKLNSQVKTLAGSLGIALWYSGSCSLRQSSCYCIFARRSSRSQTIYCG